LIPEGRERSSGNDKLRLMMMRKVQEFYVVESLEEVCNDRVVWVAIRKLKINHKIMYS